MRTGVLIGIASVGTVGLVVGSLVLMKPWAAGTGSDVGAVEYSSDPKLYGQRLYARYCSSCHGADGKGMPGVHPPVAGSEWVVGEPWRLRRILLHGPRGPFDVGGVRYSSDKMPAFGPQLADEQIAAIATYMRSAWGHSASAVTSDHVAATRFATRGRREGWTADELRRIAIDDYIEPATAPSAKRSDEARQSARTLAE